MFAEKFPRDAELNPSLALLDRVVLEDVATPVLTAPSA